MSALSQEDQNYLKTVSLQAVYRNARDATFDYCVKKADKGKDPSFVHSVGKRRYDAALDGIRAMDAMADQLDLRSPVDKLIDETRMSVLQNRKSRDWDENQTERVAAKLMYAMSVDHQSMSREEQKQRLAPQRLEQGIAYIRGQDAFKRMMRNEGDSGVADHVAEGHGKLTDAYVKGMNDIAPAGSVRKPPQQMTPEERQAVWKNQKLQM